MKRLIIPIALACGVAATPALSQSLGLGNARQHGPAQPSQEQALPPAGQHPDANQGRLVALGGEFGTLRTACTQCHQLDGAGDPSGAFPRLTNQSAWYIYSSLRDFADGKRQSQVMTPIAKELSDGQMQDVAAFYATVTGVPYPPRVHQDKATVQQGSSIAQSGLSKSGVPACNTCHGQQGVGSPPLYPYLAGQYESYLQAQLEAFKSGERKGDPMGVMRSIASQLNDQEIKAVAAYYASLSPQHVTPGGLTIQSGSAGTRSGTTPQTQAHENAAGRTEQIQNVGATKNPQPQMGNSILPGASTQSPSSSPGHR
jgi:cytochrome c553